MQISLNTHSPFGVLTSKRQVVVEDSLFDQITAKFYSAKSDGNKAAMAKHRNELLDKYFTKHIKPGQTCVINSKSTLNEGKSQSDNKFSAAVKWYPQADYLKVTADVTDAYFGTKYTTDKVWESSCFEVYISAGGVDEDIIQFIVSPNGKNGNAQIFTYKNAQKRELPAGVKASYKRTAAGYTVNLRVPWSAVDNYKPGWKVLPVEAAIDTVPPLGRVQAFMSRGGGAWYMSRGFMGLLAK